MRSLQRLQPALLGLLFLGAWEAGVRLSGVASFILPPPSLVAARFAQAGYTVFSLSNEGALLNGAIRGFLDGTRRALA